MGLCIYILYWKQAYHTSLPIVDSYVHMQSTHMTSPLLVVNCYTQIQQLLVIFIFFFRPILRPIRQSIDLLVKRLSDSRQNKENTKLKPCNTKVKEKQARYNTIEVKQNKHGTNEEPKYTKQTMYNTHVENKAITKLVFTTNVQKRIIFFRVRSKSKDWKTERPKQDGQTRLRSSMSEEREHYF